MALYNKNFSQELDLQFMLTRFLAWIKHFLHYQYLKNVLNKFYNYTQFICPVQISPTCRILVNLSNFGQPVEFWSTCPIFDNLSKNFGQLVQFLTICLIFLNKQMCFKGRKRSQKRTRERKLDRLRKIF